MLLFVLRSVIAVSDNPSDFNTLPFVIFPCVSLLVVVILILLVVCVCRHRRQRQAADAKSRIEDPLCRNGNVAAAATPVSEFPLEFPASSVRLVRDICEDHRFRGSRVYLGQLMAVQHRPCWPVVVRMLAVDADECTRTEFWRDVDALHALRHPHVAAVVGVSGRSLVGAASASVMLECGPDFVTLQQYVIYAGSDPAALDHASRLLIALQIAAGMDYLSSRGIVHGDLAARSVMITSSPDSNNHPPPVVAKLSVGLSLGPALFPGDYQKVRVDGPPLPVRWMAPEAIATGGGSLTTPADVWSYGVTLWELYSAGCRPYEGFADHDLVELIVARQLLPCPPPPAQTAVGTSRVFSLMIDCWAPEPGDRPTFGDVLARLEQWQAADATAAATRRPDSTARSNSAPCNRDAVPSRRVSPFAGLPARVCHSNDNRGSRSRSPVIVQEPPSEQAVDGNSTPRGVNRTAVAPLSQHHFRRRVAHDPSAASPSPERRHSDRQLLPPQPTDAPSLRTVDVL